MSEQPSGKKIVAAQVVDLSKPSVAIYDGERHVCTFDPHNGLTIGADYADDPGEAGKAFWAAVEKAFGEALKERLG